MPVKVPGPLLFVFFLFGFYLFVDGFIAETPIEFQAAGKSAIGGVSSFAAGRLVPFFAEFVDASHNRFIERMGAPVFGVQTFAFAVVQDLSGDRIPMFKRNAVKIFCHPRE